MLKLLHTVPLFSMSIIFLSYFGHWKIPYISEMFFDCSRWNFGLHLEQTIFEKFSDLSPSQPLDGPTSWKVTVFWKIVLLLHIECVVWFFDVSFEYEVHIFFLGISIFENDSFFWFLSFLFTTPTSISPRLSIREFCREPEASVTLSTSENVKLEEFSIAYYTCSQ